MSPAEAEEERIGITPAIDANIFDYVRTFNDPYTGSGIISRVQGGLGLFFDGMRTMSTVVRL